MTSDLARCLSCHTSDDAMTTSAVEAGADWRCARCGQAWSALRLATAASYAAWAFTHRPAASGFRLFRSS